ncbi:hypothetical protein [Shewanella waksmanii]|uniref:hypothetical protein n=1 Tax=Shewanella waksmanii TaxID=213783 RepID=UPI003735DC21
MILKTIINKGATELPFAAASRIRTTNVIGLITVFISLLYSLNYLIVIGNQTVGLINLIFTIAYAGTNLLTAIRQAKIAKIWFLSY